MIKKIVPTSFTNANTIGALSETDVLFLSLFQGKRVLNSIRVPTASSNPSERLEFLWQTGLSSIWVLPGTVLSRVATSAWFEQENPDWVAIAHPTPHAPTRPSCVVLWPRGHGQRETRRLILVFPEHAGWDWVLPDARSLLATVTYLDQVLARPVIDPPELVAQQLLNFFTRDQPPAFLHAPLTDGPPLSRKDGIPIRLQDQARDLRWMRSLTLTEQRQRYLHKYIHFSWSLAACLSVQLGGGVAEYSSTGRAYDGVRPGIWRIQAERAGSLFDGKHLPRGIESEWMSTPQVKCCQDLSYQVSVQEGSFWPQAHALLQPWAQMFWQAAERLYTRPQHYRHTQGRENTRRAITHLAHLGLTIIASEESKGGWNRPDWWAQIIGRSRSLLFAHLASLARKGTMPVLIDHDAFWVVSDDPNPLTAIPGLVSVRKWNGYRVGYEVALPLSGEVQAAFRTTEQPGQVARMLDALASEDLLLP